MTEIEKLVLNLLNENKTANEICEKINITRNRLYNILLKLKNEGITTERKYYYDGNIRYKLIKDYIPRLKTPNKIIITSPEDQEFDAIIISDIHIGNEYERLDLLKRVYDYCTKENIHIILIGGDIIDGMFGNGHKLHNNYFDQINYFIKKYPFDKNILNFTILGNHDVQSLNTEGINLAYLLENKRHDIVPIGYNDGFINIKNDKINLRHYIANGHFSNDNNIPIVIHGHSHGPAKIATAVGVGGMNVLRIFLPSLSDLQFAGPTYLSDNVQKGLPSVMRIKSQFKNGIFGETLIAQLYFQEKNIYVLNELKINLEYNRTKEADNTNIRNIEQIEQPPKVKIIQPPSKEMLSQIEKFNKKWKI